MPAPKRKLELNEQTGVVSGSPVTTAYVETKPAKVLCKAFHMVVGVDLIGSKTSLASSRNMELEVTPLGIKAYSKNSGRLVLIPWTNIKGAELFT